jgi:AAA domain
MSGTSRIDWPALNAFEHDNAESICRHFFPLGKKFGHEWKLGDTTGAAGNSLGIELAGEKAGLWQDRATREKGRLRNLIAAKAGISDQAAVEEIERAFGHTFRINGTNGTNGKSFDWMRCVSDMAASDKLRELEPWRGWSREFCAWLVAQKKIALHEQCYAFPIQDASGKVYGTHFLRDRPNKKWEYINGTDAPALVIGNLKTASEYHIFESTWDGLSFCERAEAYKSKEVCIVITRGSSKAKTVRGIIQDRKRVYAWPQNDKPDIKTGKIPSETWFEAIEENLSGQFHRVRTPEEFEDLNEWTKNGATKNDLLDAIDSAEPIGDPPKIYIEFLRPSQILAYVPPPGTVLVGDNHIVRGSVFVVAGPPGVGKSRGSVALAEAGATKLDWLGQPVHAKFKTLIVQNENGRYRLKLELSGISEDVLEEYLLISPPPPFGMRFDKIEFRDQLQMAIALHDPGVVFIDPWNAVARDDKAKDYHETFDIIREVIPAGDTSPAIGINAHTRKPALNERTNGRSLLNLLAGSYVLASVPRTVWVLQHASDDVNERRVVVTCCKNNDGQLGDRSVWTRDNGLWSSVPGFDWEAWDSGEKEGDFSVSKVAEIVAKNTGGISQPKLIAGIKNIGASKSAAYRWVQKAEKSGEIRFQKGKDVYVIS